MLRAIFSEAILIPKDSSVHTSVNFWSAQLISKVDALINSGATDNFISPNIIQQFDIPTCILDKQLAIQNVDETPNKLGKVDHTADLTFRFRRKPYTQSFYIADLGEDHMLLGMPFLSTTSPDIDWTKGKLQGKVEASTIDAYHKPLSNQVIKPAEMKKALKESCYHTILANFTNHKDEEPLVVQCTTKSTALAADAMDKTEHTWQEQIPAEYHKYDKVFSKEASQRFPDQRP